MLAELLIVMIIMVVLTYCVMSGYFSTVSGKRDRVQTVTEEHFIDTLKNYGKFIGHTSYLDFPYMRTIKDFWRIIFRTFSKTMHNSGLINAVFSNSLLIDVVLGLITTMFLVQMYLLSLISKVVNKSKTNDAIYLAINVDENDTDKIKKIMADFNVGVEYEGKNEFVISVKRRIQFTRLLCTFSKFNVNVKSIGFGNSTLDKLRVMLASKISDLPTPDTALTYLVSWSNESETKHIYIVKCENILNFIKEIKENHMYVEHIF